MHAEIIHVGFRKVLAKYYKQWLEDCIASSDFCRKHGNRIGSKKYLDDATRYAKIIEDNKEAIEFFSKDDNAFKIDSALPEQFRGYK